jgi:hypothetical protein
MSITPLVFALIILLFGFDFDWTGDERIVQGISNFLRSQRSKT